MIASSYPAKCSKLLNIFESAVYNYTHCAVGKAKPDHYLYKDTWKFLWNICLICLVFMVTFGKKCFQFTLYRLGLWTFSLYFVLQFQVHTKKTWREPAETSNAWSMSSIARLVRYGGRWKRNINKISWSRYAKRENKERNGVTTANKWIPRTTMRTLVRASKLGLTSLESANHQIGIED